MTAFDKPDNADRWEIWAQRLLGAVRRRQDTEPLVAQLREARIALGDPSGLDPTSEASHAYRDALQPLTLALASVHIDQLVTCVEDLARAGTNRGLLVRVPGERGSNWRLNANVRRELIGIEDPWERSGPLFSHLYAIEESARKWAYGFVTDPVMGPLTAELAIHWQIHYSLRTGDHTPRKGSPEGPIDRLVSDLKTATGLSRHLVDVLPATLVRYSKRPDGRVIDPTVSDVRSMYVDNPLVPKLLRMNNTIFGNLELLLAGCNGACYSEDAATVWEGSPHREIVRNYWDLKEPKDRQLELALKRFRAGHAIDLPFDAAQFALFGPDREFWLNVNVPELRDLKTGRMLKDLPTMITYGCPAIVRRAVMRIHSLVADMCANREMWGYALEYGLDNISERLSPLAIETKTSLLIPDEPGNSAYLAVG